MEKILNISGQNEVEEESYTASVDSQWLDMSWLDRCVFFYQILYITFLTLIVGSWIMPAVCSESTYP